MFLAAGYSLYSLSLSVQRPFFNNDAGLRGGGPVLRGRVIPKAKKPKNSDEERRPAFSDHPSIETPFQLGRKSFSGKWHGKSEWQRSDDNWRVCSP
jgi:hypothetical protein